MAVLSSGLLLLSAVPTAPSPGEARTLLELLGAFLGLTKWPVLGLTVIAIALALSGYKRDTEEQSVGFWAACGVAGASGGWFLASLVAGE